MRTPVLPALLCLLLACATAHAQTIEELLADELARGNTGRILLATASIEWQQNGGLPVEPAVAELRSGFRAAVPGRCDGLLRLMGYDYRSSPSATDQRLLDTARRYLAPLHAHGMDTAPLENTLAGMLAWSLLRDEPPLCACLLPRDTATVQVYCARHRLRPDGNWPF